MGYAMSNEQNFKFTREVKRNSLETTVSTRNVQKDGVKLLCAGFEKIPQKIGYMFAYVILDKDNVEVANYFLGMLEESGTILITIR